MQITFNSQVEACERSAVETLMATLVAQFHAIGSVVWKYQDSNIPLTDQDAAQIHQQYARLGRIFDEVLVHGRTVERATGSPIDGKTEFLAAWKELKGIIAVAPRSVGESLEETRKGGGKSLGEFADELSRDLKL